ncbi:putative caib baif family enzyme protein [Neofusicoccum parvum UCRNP2]|uniref:Putative caib baif family enzyme protein n=1 Tax=Botryosphaeria parva (strain UCR-NP2) TaxID=1287680 RepID=R1EE73_BOTPV|nr:putative caib baif family enzyme protein [Neofusicoccum parvum UCRNP2]
MASVPRSDASDSRVLDAKESNVPDGFKPHHEAVGMGRENFTPLDIVKEIWAGLGLPETSLDSLLGLSPTASRSDVADKTRQWNSIDLETAGLQNKLAMYALRSYKEWDALPQAAAIDKFPISIQRICNGPASLPPRVAPGNDRCLRGLRVLELTRVIAGPLAGRTLAAHGADVLWVTCPSLPDLPAVDRDLARGKRSIQLDLRDAAGKAKLLGLIASCDVFIQGYRPGSLAARGLAPEQLAEINPGIVCANMSAFGPEGPWKERRGFDSLVQTASGMNVSEAEHYGDILYWTENPLDNMQSVCPY